MNLKKLTVDVQKAGRFKSAREARVAINSVFQSLRRGNIQENAGATLSVFKHTLREKIEKKDPFEGAKSFLLGGDSHLRRLGLANLRVRIQRSIEAVCDSELLLSSVFSGIKAQLTADQVKYISEKISDGALEKLWNNA